VHALRLGEEPDDVVEALFPESGFG
jgi:hypothetical protein